MVKQKNFLKNKLLVPIGQDNRLYFSLLEKYKPYIRGVFIGWPGQAPTGRELAGPSRKFFDAVYRWCVKNQKIFNILFNMEPHDFKKSLKLEDINLKPYENELTELTFSSTILMKNKAFDGFKKNISVNMKVNSLQQLYALKKDNPDINAVVLDRDINRNRKLVNEIISQAKKMGVAADLLINEGCVPFCPNKKDHNAFITLSHFSEQKECINKATEVCSTAFYKDPPSILRSPFLTREALPSYGARLFKLCDRTMHPSILYAILDYYICGKKIDLGIAFSVKRIATGLTTDMLSKAFHKRIMACANQCYACDACEITYGEIANKYNKSKPVSNLPVEVMIEVESRCNFNCQFCFNKNSFAKDGRNGKNLSTAYVKKIIDGLSKAEIKVVRFTGGEPLLRKDIFQLMEYAKSKKLEVRLNTNGSLVTEKSAKKLKGLVDNILISMESCDEKSEGQIANHTGALGKKIKAVKLLKQVGIPIVRVGTVMSKENIKNFDKFTRLILSLPADEWEWYRPISSGQKSRQVSPKEIKILADKIIELRKKTKKPVFIANALPFCAIKDTKKMEAGSEGAIFDDGHSRLVVDPRGFLKPHYFMEENIGDPLDILGAWNNAFMKKMRNLEFLPKACQKCEYKFKCRGGSRYEAKTVFGKYDASDPLANPKNIKTR